MADQPMAFDDERVTRELHRLHHAKQANERLVRMVGDLTATFGDLARAGNLANASLQEMDRILRLWPFKRRLPRRTKKALTKLDAGLRLTPRERRSASRVIANGNATLDRLQQKMP